MKVVSSSVRRLRLFQKRSLPFNHSLFSLFTIAETRQSFLPGSLVTLVCRSSLHHFSSTTKRCLRLKKGVTTRIPSGKEKDGTASAFYDVDHDLIIGRRNGDVVRIESSMTTTSARQLHVMLREMSIDEYLNWTDEDQSTNCDPTSRSNGVEERRRTRNNHARNTRIVAAIAHLLEIRVTNVNCISINHSFLVSACFKMKCIFTVL